MFFIGREISHNSEDFPKGTLTELIRKAVFEITDYLFG